MKAIVLDSLGPLESSPFQLREYETPIPSTDQVVIGVTACGVCRSNLHMIEGDWESRGVPAKLPIVPGHEVVGVIADLGPGVSEFQVGDRVGVQPLWYSCGRCSYCLTGREQLCAKKEITGETVDGGYAEYMLASTDHLYLVPESLGDAEAAPLFCPGVTAYRAVGKAELGPGKDVAIFGVGGVGHLVIQLALLAGAEVTAVARSRQHLELAEELGVQHVINASTENVEAVFDARGGVDAAIVFAPSGSVARQAMRAVKPGGIGVFGVQVDIGELPGEEKRIVDTLIGSREDMHEVLRLGAAGKLHVTYETFPLEDAGTALARLKADDLAARAVLVI